MKLSTIHKLVMRAPAGHLTLYEFMKPLRKAFKPYPWIRFEQKELRDAPGFSDAVAVSGHFDPDFCGRSICFVTLSGYSRKENHLIQFEGAMRDRLLFDVFATVAHERIHLLQSRKAHGCPRAYKLSQDGDQKLAYYGSTDEIDAFGHTAAMEERYWGPSEVVEKYRTLFQPDDFRFKRFLKKKWKHSLTLPTLI